MSTILLSRTTRKNLQYLEVGQRVEDPIRQGRQLVQSNISARNSCRVDHVSPKRADCLNIERGVNVQELQGRERIECARRHLGQRVSI